MTFLRLLCFGVLNPELPGSKFSAVIFYEHDLATKEQFSVSVDFFQKWTVEG